MSAIWYKLDRSSNLAGMAPAPLPGGTFGNARLPDGMDMAGTYIIVNVPTNNRYIGIAGNIRNRFKDRLPTVTEMGFAVYTMAGIGVTWGASACKDTPTISNPSPDWVDATPDPPNAFVARVDGWDVNLEQLLIRFVITQLGVGGTVSNNVYAKQSYRNPTGNTVTVRLDWGEMGGLFNAGFQEADWGAGESW